ncbi:hypothetical protein ACTFIV_011103 [Dictyostelium citrinum]
MDNCYWIILYQIKKILKKSIDCFYECITKKKSSKFNNVESSDKLKIHYVDVKAGGCWIHHGKVWHGSNSNSSLSNVRVCIAIHFIPGDSEYKPNYLVQIRGIILYNYIFNDYISPIVSSLTK